MSVESKTESKPVEESPTGPTENFKTYLVPRLTTSSIAAGVFGASTHYYTGGSAFLGLYSYGFVGGLGSAAFFGGNYLLRYARKKDDIYNYAGSGALTGAMFGGFKLRSGIIGGIVGSLGGIIYRVASTSLYEYTRESWIDHRRFRIETSEYRVLEMRPARIDPRFLNEGSRVPYPVPEPMPFWREPTNSDNAPKK